MLKRIFLLGFLLWFLAGPTLAQGPIYLPSILKMTMPNHPDPILRIVSANGTTIDLLGFDSGLELADPYWNPQIAQYKGGGAYVNSAIAEGERLVHKEYGNVVESIPLSVRGVDQDKAMQTISDLLALGSQGADYWTEFSQLDGVWLEAKLPCNSCFTGYARIVKTSIPELSNPFGQPFFGPYNEAVMEGITLIVEREPLWRGVPPGEIIGPLYNLIKNPDFELWNFGVEDSQPNSWSDLETIQITGQNSREITSPHSGNYALKIRVGGSTAAGRVKGVSQVVADTKPNTKYTVIAWVRSEGVSKGVGRVLITYSGQLELYRSSSRHGWGIFVGTFTTGTSDTVAINLEILTTAANTDGTIYVDSLMLVPGNWTEEAELSLLPYMSSSHIVNHWDQPDNAAVEAGDINFVDVWNVPGNEDALVLLEFLNNTQPADPDDQVELYGAIRIGQRRTGDVFGFTNYHDPPGFSDATASSDDRLETPNLNNSFLQITSKLLVGPDTIRVNQGRFRAFARIYDTKASSPTLQTRLRYFVGASGVADKILDTVDSPVRGQWHIVNLTKNAAVNFDKKFSFVSPGQLGFAVEMKRKTGSDKGYLDYILLMPTDGGYIEASLNPALPYLGAMTVDGISGQPAIYSTQLPVGFRVVYNTTPSQQNIIGYKGSVFFGAGTRVYKFTGNTGVLAFDFPGASFPVFEVFNDKLMVSADSKLYENDGVTFPGTLLAVTGTNGNMKVFNGKLWLLSSAAGAVVSNWDGSTITVSLSVAGSDNTGIEVYNGKLYAAINTPARIYEYNPVSNAWSLSFTFPGSVTSCRRLGVFNGKLYAGTGLTGGLYVFDGSSWSLAKTFNTSTELREIWAIHEFDGKLYLGGATTGGGGRIMTSEDGITFETVYDSTQYFISSLVSYQGSLYATTRLVKSPGFDFLAFTPQQGSNQFQVSDWKGLPFTSPAQKRHRYVFSYDRENFINNADDKALIGLGFIPRYLTLRGRF
ncbi:MAG: hypothetical protein ACREIQ_03480 [Nitrospiria bacterium]